MQSAQQLSAKYRAIGGAAFFWFGMLIAAELLVSQPPVKGRGLVWQQMARVAVFPGDTVARLIGSQFAGPVTDWTYWLTVFVASFVFWVPLTTYILNRRKWRGWMGGDDPST
jgi:hypothetical protein